MKHSHNSKDVMTVKNCLVTETKRGKQRLRGKNTLKQKQKLDGFKIKILSRECFIQKKFDL